MKNINLRFCLSSDLSFLRFQVQIESPKLFLFSGRFLQKLVLMAFLFTIKTWPEMVVRNHGERFSMDETEIPYTSANEINLSSRNPLKDSI